MDILKSRLVIAKYSYDKGGITLHGNIADVVSHALDILSKRARVEFMSKLGDKKYSSFREGKNVTRPFRPDLFIANGKTFVAKWKKLISAINPNKQIIELPAGDVNRVLYTAISAFSCCYDLWNPRSRKTPGTFFEVLLGSVIGRILTTHIQSKFIPLPIEVETDALESVSTDIVFTSRSGHEKNLVIPAKITTRERIVQPFAHQRILDSVLGVGHFKSVLLCVSEQQRNEKGEANEICVPGTIRLFQKHLAPMYGIYYLDPPRRYLQPDVTSIIPVKTIGEFLTADLPLIISP